MVTLQEDSLKMAEGKHPCAVREQLESVLKDLYDFGDDFVTPEETILDHGQIDDLSDEKETEKVNGHKENEQPVTCSKRGKKTVSMFFDSIKEELCSRAKNPTVSSSPAPKPSTVQVVSFISRKDKQCKEGDIQEVNTEGKETTSICRRGRFLETELTTNIKETEEENRLQFNFEKLFSLANMSSNSKDTNDTEPKAADGARKIRSDRKYTNNAEQKDADAARKRKQRANKSTEDRCKRMDTVKYTNDTESKAYDGARKIRSDIKYGNDAERKAADAGPKPDIGKKEGASEIQARLEVHKFGIGGYEKEKQRKCEQERAIMLGAKVCIKSVGQSFVRLCKGLLKKKRQVKTPGEKRMPSLDAACAVYLYRDGKGSRAGSSVGGPVAASPLCWQGRIPSLKWVLLWLYKRALPICCNLSTTESTPGQSEDSTCPEEKRGWNPELQKNGETKVAELARLLRANSANGKRTPNHPGLQKQNISYVSKV
ncbi:unnamed protein product [Ranitomeya imitator]|uniref:Uncharacterized protein n=1 Tax=Ranitomeya imitator TaxID=111125 RepID=A0ABN9L303_9NEOB|nr:unnamed protein product [Ranitomeya imitator]